MHQNLVLHTEGFHTPSSKNEDDTLPIQNILNQTAGSNEDLEEISEHDSYLSLNEQMAMS